MKKLLAIWLLLLALPAYAGIDFSPVEDDDVPTYTGTLDNLYGESQSTINSGYILTITEVAQGRADFVYYYDDGASITPKYYKINVEDNAGKTGGTTYTARRNNSIGIVPQGWFVGANTTSAGGAIYNMDRDIGDLIADFIGNYAKTGSVSGGAISNNTGTIGNITGDFIGNYATTSTISSYSYGGAIHNSGTIGNINGNFIRNYATATGSSSPAKGGAIYNYAGTIGDITGDFIGNYATTTTTSSSSSVSGGAIYNWVDSIGNITGNFIGNYAKSYTSASGGAIYNTGTIGNITGDFIGNYANGYTSAFGGAIYNYDVDTIIGDITGDFIGNYVTATPTVSSCFAYGGAIYNKDGARIGDITGDFISNYATSITYSNSEAYGGAIYNYAGTIGNITGDFIGNYANSKSGTAVGGAIYNNYGTIGDITGDFIGNYATTSTNSFYAYGGAIFNNGTIGDITGDFIENYSLGAVSVAASGGAIYNGGVIGNITGNFIGNYATATDSPYSGNSTKGGAIYNGSTIGNITGDFIGNYAKGSVHTIVYGGAIFNGGEIGNITGNFIGNYATGYFGALGGAIYTTKNMTFVADGLDTQFTDNYTQDPTRGKLYNAIYVATYDYFQPTLTFNTSNNGTITLNDQIEGVSYNLSITGDGTGKTIFNNPVINAGTVSVANSTLQLGSYQHADTADNHGLFTPAWNTDQTSAYASPTTLSLTDSSLILDYATPQTLRLASLNMKDGSDIVMGGNSILANKWEFYGANTITGDINFGGKPLNFYVPTSAAANYTMLSVSGEANITGSAVNVGINGALSPLLIGDKIYLIDAATLTGMSSNNSVLGSNMISIMQGVSLIYDFDLSKSGNKLVATLTGGADAVSPTPTCGANASVVGGSCVCDMGYSGDGQTCTADPPLTCDANAHDESGTCVCDTGYTDDGTSCIADDPSPTPPDDTEPDDTDFGNSATPGAGAPAGRLNPQTKSFSEGKLAGMAFINQGSDMSAGAGMNAMMSSSKTNGASSFSAVSSSQSRYETGSHIDVSGLSLITGIGQSTNVRPGKFSIGGFIELGNGSYNTYNSFANAATVEGDGSTFYIGAGGLGRLDFNNKIYLDGSFRLGNISSDYKSENLRDYAGTAASYKTSSMYYGGHFGVGFVANLINNFQLDSNGKFLITHQNADDVKISTGEEVKFDAVNSSRARLAEKLSYAFVDGVKPYVSLGYEYEFGGEMNAKVYDRDITAPSLKGSSGDVGAGISVAGKQLSLDISFQQFFGLREGVAGMLQLKYMFGAEEPAVIKSDDYDYNYSEYKSKPVPQTQFSSIESDYEKSLREARERKAKNLRRAY